MGYWFRIVRLELTGDKVESATLFFKDWLNVVVWPSNTGKSYVFQCINFMLGETKPPKDIVQSKGYGWVSLELKSSDEQSYTLKSRISGGDIFLYHCTTDEISIETEFKVLSRKSWPWKQDTISSFLLGLINLRGKKICSKKTSGKTKELYYWDIRDFVLIDEVQVIKEVSPVLGDDYIKDTERRSVFRFLLTGKDDADMVEVMDKDEIANKRGRLAVLAEMILKFSSDGLKEGVVTRFDSLEAVEEEISKAKSEQQWVQNKISALDSEKREIETALVQMEIKLRDVEEILSRSAILDRQYVSDKERLHSTIEASKMLAWSQHTGSKCPLCSQKLEKECDEALIAGISLSCEVEIKKINSLRKELFEAVELLKKDKAAIEQKTTDYIDQMRGINERLATEMRISLNEVGDKLNLLYFERGKFNKDDFVKWSIDEMFKQKREIELQIANNKPEILSEINSSVLKDFCYQVQILLKWFWYPKAEDLDYDDKASDLIIWWSSRSTYWKWYRAIAYSAFILGLARFIKDSWMPFSIGVPVLDSPLTTYKESKSENQNIEELPEDMTKNFYKAISSDSSFDQIIVIENKEPPIELEGVINVIRFTRDEIAWRYWFIPLP